MSLPKAYTNNYGKIPQLFNTIRDGNAPETFSVQHLKDLGFTSSHDRGMIAMMKELGFLTSDGRPTQKYMSYIDKSRSKQVITDAVRETYKDIFVLKATPTKADIDSITGKFKSEFNTTEKVAKTRAHNFFSLLDLCDFSIVASATPKAVEPKEAQPSQNPPAPPKVKSFEETSPSLHYNIQIHLPATKDVEVYNAIFKSLKEHLID